MQVAKWGNSLAVRLPADLVRELGLKEGDQVDTQLGRGSFRSTVTSTSTDSIVADIIPTTEEDKNGNPAS